MYNNADQKKQIAVQNQNTVLTFGSQLDQSLKNLHRSILGSVSHQQQQIQCMEEHVSSFFAYKQDVSHLNSTDSFVRSSVLIVIYSFRQHKIWNQRLPR